MHSQTEQVSLQAAIEFAAHSSFNLIGLKYIHQLPVHSWKEPKCWLRGSFFHNKKKIIKKIWHTTSTSIEGLHIFGIGCTWNALWFQHWAELQSCLNENFFAYIVSQKRSKTQWKKIQDIVLTQLQNKTMECFWQSSLLTKILNALFPLHLSYEIHLLLHVC